MVSTPQQMSAADCSTCITRPQYDRPMVQDKTGFFDLPLEIRAIIIRAILGDRKIHVHYPQNASTGIYVARFSFCIHKTPREDAHQRKTDILSRSYASAHSSCHAMPGCTLRALGWPRSYHWEVDRPDLHFERDLSLMTVSKQLRVEAIRAFYTTNVFSIADSTSFKLFTARILFDRAHLIKTLELSTTKDAGKWNMGFADSYGKPATEWKLNRDQQRKLRNVSDITIQLCVLEPKRTIPREQPIPRAQRAKDMFLTLQAAFSSLGKLRTLDRMEADMRQRDIHQSEMQEIGREL